jgi:restriction system protein
MYNNFMNPTRLCHSFCWKSLLIEIPKRGYMNISQRGREVLSQNPDRINVKFLEQFSEFVEFRKKTKTQSNSQTVSFNDEEQSTPEDLLSTGMKMLNASLAEVLLEKIFKNSAAFFETLVLDLLTNMGYGEGHVTGRSGDGGIDGVINQDALGIEKISFQAKRFTGKNKVSASMVRDFVGSLELKGVSKGVFITSTDFPANTKELLSATQKSIVLINQRRLLELMIKYNVGVSTKKL